MTGCMIFVVCRTCALIAVLCLAKETNLKKYGNEWGSRMSNKIRNTEHVHIVALHFFFGPSPAWDRKGSRSDTLADINTPHSPDLLYRRSLYFLDLPHVSSLVRSNKN